MEYDKLFHAKMGRYAHISPFLCFFFSVSFIILFFIPVARSQLPENQKNAVKKLSTYLGTDPNNPCSWKGVTCSNNNQSITHLSFPSSMLSKSDFLPDLCQIHTLQSLDVSKNYLSIIPDQFIRDCGGINGLKKLNFSMNRVSGLLPTFEGFGGLQYLDLSYNSFNGSIDSQLNGLNGLRSLNLSFNQFSGSVPSKLGKAMALEGLELAYNHFVGQIPEEYMNYTSLVLLDLSNNLLSGSVSDSIGQLSKLETLLLSSNHLNGGIPVSLSRIETLYRFASNQNHFSGNIPSGISKYLRNLDLSYNNLTGSIPSDFLSPLNLQYVDLTYNSLEGPIPSNISESLIRLRLGSNSLDGTIPSLTDGKLSQLTYLELDNNKLTGLVPPQLGTFQRLALLNLAQNDLYGLLPKELGNLHQLQVLKLQSNKLTGEIPQEYSQLWKLSILNISRNSLNSSIPSAISSLGNLTILDLRENRFDGSIPDSIGNLNSLLELQLGDNKLSGKIPSMPGKLQIALNLSRNLFDGSIPDTLKGLSALEVLDLSHNKFTGEIPRFLAGLPSLTLLLLSNNLLCGNRPNFLQPGIVVDTNGTNVNTTPTSGPTPGPTTTSPKKRSSILVAVIVAIAAVAAVAVIGVIAVLFLRRFYRVSIESLQPEEHLPIPQIIDYHMITANVTHRSSIDFTRAMETVANPANIILKSRFSTYFKAIMPNGESYYIKKLNWTDKIFQLGTHEKFGEELGVLGKLSNATIMSPLAYVLTTDSAYLFYEYAQQGTLFDVLHGSLGHALDWASRYSIAIGVAQGLAFLHGCSSGPVLLLDLSSKSIFLKSLKEPQIGDVELCKVIDPSKSTGSLSTVAGSVGYIPPEYAYTMSVVLLELLTGKPAVSEGTELAKWVLNNSIHRDTLEKILDFTISRTSLGVRSQMLAVLRVALACVCDSPDSRPNMKSVVRMLLNAR
ncbi:leucine-rich repeat receptor-like tyrosine-protein kinase PXC3 isoform X2 [Telopea speciosissima]|uniref:leucine-rich repeat receptor-like tyrosine-protein kinase PXC3 isoform X2 n=1 Tax=Telopea speciosissima TaxID=54955 RepID=UPI001CC6C4A9|nr:leucine-rich repeat receptor-like tyrosine-protein kinase PXC3 isoform X2 [Telopea speciosissima]